MIFELVAAAGLAFGFAIGLGSLFAPHWAAGVVRLVADPERPGGFSEFRATYGGLLALSHGAALVALLALPALPGTMAAMPLALGWLGAAIGRTLSLLLDRDELRGTAMNPTWIATELALAIAIGLPVLQLV